MDIDRVLQCCQDCFAQAALAEAPLPGARKAAAESPWKNLFCVEARLYGCPGTKVAALTPAEMLEALKAGNVLHWHDFVVTAGGRAPPPHAWAPPLGKVPGAVWWWCVPTNSQSHGESVLRGLAESALQDSCLELSTPRAKWAREDVPELEVARLEDELLRAGPPEGYFFDGTRYIDVDGVSCRHHPEIERHLAELVEMHNAEVDRERDILAESAKFFMLP